jgi:hypothetical protein
VRAVSDRRRKRDAVYPVRREQVWERAGGVCEFVGRLSASRCIILPVVVGRTRIGWAT